MLRRASIPYPLIDPQLEYCSGCNELTQVMQGGRWDGEGAGGGRCTRSTVTPSHWPSSRLSTPASQGRKATPSRALLCWRCPSPLPREAFTSSRAPSQVPAQQVCCSVGNQMLRIKSGAWQLEGQDRL